MSTMLLFQDDALFYKSVEPRQMEHATGNQADNPGQDLQTIGAADVGNLPDPAIGGENGSRIRNGFTVGVRSIAQRFQPLMGQMAKAPVITNPVQGEVGTTNRSSRQYAGVLNQFVRYTPQLAQLETFVGKLPEETKN